MHTKHLVQHLVNSRHSITYPSETSDMRMIKAKIIPEGGADLIKKM